MATLTKPVRSIADAVVAPYNAYDAYGSDYKLTGSGDVAALLTLQDRLYSAKGGGIIHILGGDIMSEQNWLISKPVDIICASKGAWSDPAPSASALNATRLIAPTGRNWHMVTIDLAYNVNDITVEGLCIENGVAGDYDALLVQQTANKETQNVNLRNVRATCYGARHAFVLAPNVATHPLPRIRMEHCEAEDCSNGDGLHIDASVAAIKYLMVTGLKSRSDKRAIYATGDIRRCTFVGGTLEANQETLYLDSISGAGSLEFHGVGIASGIAVSDTYNIIHMNAVAGVKFFGFGAFAGGTSEHKYGLYMAGCFYNEFHGLHLHDGNRGGVRLEGSSRNTFVGGLLLNTCQKANNSYDAFSFGTTGGAHSTRNVVTGLHIRETLANKARYGIAEDNSNQDYNIVTACQVEGPVTGLFQTAGVHSDFSHIG